MKHNCINAGLAAAALGALLAGCATTVEMGPGYYHWDTHAVDLSSATPAATASEPKVAYQSPPVVVKETPPIDNVLRVAPAPGTPRM
jgi:hypothetical protein